MLQKVLLGLCLIPVLAHAEIACLEGPSGGRCQNVDVHGEIFKTSTPASADTQTTAKPTVATANPANKRVNFVIKPNQQKATTNRVNRQQVATNDSRQSIAEQRIRQRAQMMEQRFMRKQSINNLSARNNTN